MLKKGVLIKVNERPKAIEYEDNLETLQKIVGGNIEYFGIGDGVCIICNEEGKLKNLDPNFYIKNSRNQAQLFVGDCLLVNTSSKTGNNINMTKHMLNYFTNNIKFILTRILEI